MKSFRKVLKVILLLVGVVAPGILMSPCSKENGGLSSQTIGAGEHSNGTFPIIPSNAGEGPSSEDGCHDDETINETSDEESSDGSISSMVRSRAQRVMAVMREAIRGVPERLRNIPLLLGYFPGLKRTQEEIPSTFPFPCPVDASAATSRLQFPPNSVHRLTPGDISVIAAIGDSISSANGAMAQSDDGLRVNFRGVSATGGGQETWRQYLTLANILKVFNPNLKGYARESSVSADPASGLNLAENGALDEDLLFQAKTLVGKIKADPTVDFRREWKLVNILIGGNDICNEYCFVEGDKDSPEGHKRNLEEVIDFLRINMPRTVVNLIQLPNIVQLRDMKNIPLRCHIRRMILCSCLFGGADKGKADSVAKMVEGYWEAERRVSEEPRFESDEFAVLLQPFFRTLTPPPTVETQFGTSPDLSYFAPDCFHFSQKGNAHMANALWNNMMEPVGSKTIYKINALLQDFRCPTKETPYIFTRKNSETFLLNGHQ